MRDECSIAFLDCDASALKDASRQAKSSSWLVNDGRHVLVCMLFSANEHRVDSRPPRGTVNCVPAINGRDDTFRRADSENALTATVTSDRVYDNPVASIAAQSRPLWLALPGAIRGEGRVPSGPNGGGGEAGKPGESAVIKQGRVFILIFLSV